MNEDTIKSVAYRLRQDENRKIACPACVDAGKDKHDLSMSVINKGDYALYKCHRDDSHNGRINFEGRKRTEPPAEKPTEKIDPSEKELSAGQRWIEQVRGIPFERVEQFVSFGSAYFKQANGSLPCIEFIYKDENGKKVYSKFRSIEGKYFTSGHSTPGGTDTLYLTEAVNYEKPYIILCEGEIDSLSLKAAGFNAVSMPTGANVKWLVHNQNLLSKFQRVLIWFDADAKGGTVAEKLKLQPPKLIKNFTFLNPKKLAELCPDSKDANEVLLAHGTGLFKQILATCFEKHTPDYVIRPSSLMKGLVRVRDNTYANRVGINSPALDEVISLVRGYAGLVTGIPGHGKSTFLSWYAYKRAEIYGHKTVFWSPENDPTLLTADIIGMAAGRLVKGHAGALPMSDHELQTHAAFADTHFRVVQDCEEGSDIETILNQMQAAALDMGGADLYVIDPWNYIKMPNVASKNSLDAVRMVYSRIRRFAVANDCSVVVVAHPKKMDEIEAKKRDDEDDASRSESHEENGIKRYKMPGMYSISGSADFANMADFVIVVHREESHTTIANVKSRRPFLGTMGASCAVAYRPSAGDFRILSGARFDASGWREPDGAPF